MKIFDSIRNNLQWYILGAMLAGLLFGTWQPIPFSKIICFSALLVMIYPVMINVKIEDGFKIKGLSKPIIATLLINFIISPTIAVLLSTLFFASNPYIAIAMYMIGLIPTSGMTMNWINNTKANMHTGIVLVTINILLAVVLVPFALPLLVNQILQLKSFVIDPLIILEKLGFIIILPMFLAWLTRVGFKTFGKQKLLENAKPLLGDIANGGLLYVIFLVMALESSQVILKHFPQAVLLLVPILLYYLIMFQIIKFIAQKYFDREQGLPVIFATILRYHVISLGIALAAFGETDFGAWVTLPIIIAFVLQPTLMSTVVKKYIPKLVFKK